MSHQLRGADGHILKLITDLMVGREYLDMSISDLVVESGYSIPTVHVAVRRLECAFFLRREIHGSRPTRYRLIPHAERVQILVQRLQEVA